MREIFKNPMIYYLIAPLLIGLWPLLVWAHYLPDARRQAANAASQCTQGEVYMLDIIHLNPSVLDFVPDKSEAEFSFAKAIDRVANMCRIPSASCDFTAGSTDKKTQNAKVTLKSVGIVQAAKFLSDIQSNYVGLKCDQVKLTKKKGMPDQWDVEMKFWYAS